jgi:hypothetical protein
MCKLLHPMDVFILTSGAVGNTEIRAALAGKALRAGVELVEDMTIAQGEGRGRHAAGAAYRPSGKSLLPCSTLLGSTDQPRELFERQQEEFTCALVDRRELAVESMEDS